MNATGPRARLGSMDLVRGAVMVLMALDHARGFFSIAKFDLTDLSRTTVALFLTRWITHLCAPLFIFLAGAGAALSKKPPRELGRFLVARGALLVALELTIVHVSFWGPQYDKVMLITLWYLGWSMIVLSGLVALPTWVACAVGLVLVGGHDLFDGLHWDSTLWKVVHDGGPISPHVSIGDPLVPWPGVMALGHAFGRVLTLPDERRRRWIVGLGASATVAFLALRALNRYGDPHPWEQQPRALFTVLSFVNCHKAPPSLDFLLMTLGPGLIALGALDGVRVGAGNPLLVFGRVPLFFYVAHLPVLRLTAAIVFAPRIGAFSLLLPPGNPVPPGYGLQLPGVYLAWALLVIALYPACRWYARLKERSRSPWLAYL
jgi:uncharacterized membrane protein